MKQEILFNQKENPKEWMEHWESMPEFTQEKQEPFAKIIVRFNSQADLDDFAKLIGQKLTPKTKSIWHPFKSHFGSGKNPYWTHE